jgi:hypothetical protein
MINKSQVVFLIIAFLAIFLFNREFIYFRDYSIIYDGASRILEGQKPYIDFGIPTGPTTYLLSTLFLKFFNGSWYALFVLQFVLNILTLLSVCGIYTKLSLNDQSFKLSIIGFSIFYLIFQTHPWYNTTSVLFLFLSIYLLLFNNDKLTLLSGVSAALAFLSKQDIGLLLIFFSPLILVKNSKKKLISLVFYYMLGIFIVLVLFTVNYKIENILYWINFGQHGYIRNPLDKQPTLLTCVSLIAIIYSLFKSSRLYLVSGIIMLISSVSINTSGLYFTHFYFVVGIIPLFIDVIKKTYINIFIFAPIFILILKPVLASDYYLIQNLIYNRPEHYLFNPKYLSNTVSYSSMENCEPTLANIIAPIDTCHIISDIKNLMSNGIIPSNGFILNMSEFRVLNSVIGYKIPKSHPLWYDKGISLYPREEKLIEYQVKKGFYDLIILQGHDIFENDDSSWLIKYIKLNKKDYLIKKYLSPNNLTDCNFQSSKCPDYIYVIYKKIN